MCGREKSLWGQMTSKDLKGGEGGLRAERSRSNRSTLSMLKATKGHDDGYALPALVRMTFVVLGVCVMAK